MNENIDLTEILKDCPNGTKLYSPLFGDVELKEIDTSKVYSVNVKLTSGLIESFTREGKLYDRDYYKDTECVLFPSKEQRDWSKFTAPWYKKKRDTINCIKKQCKPNPYSCVSFKYIGHTWDMCGRDNRVEIFVDGEIKVRIFLDNKPKGKSALEAIKEEKLIMNLQRHYVVSIRKSYITLQILERMNKSLMMKLNQNLRLAIGYMLMN